MTDHDHEETFWYDEIAYSSTVTREELRAGWVRHGSMLVIQGKRMLIVSHGGDNGHLTNDTAIKRIIEMYHSRYRVTIACCYPRRVARRYPTLARYIAMRDIDNEQDLGWCNNSLLVGVSSNALPDESLRLIKAFFQLAWGMLIR